MQYQLVTQLATCVILTGNMQISVNINCKEVLIYRNYYGHRYAPLSSYYYVICTCNTLRTKPFVETEI